MMIESYAKEGKKYVFSLWTNKLRLITVLLRKKYGSHKGKMERRKLSYAKTKQN
jgi:hypothetical protein